MNSKQISNLVVWGVSLWAAYQFFRQLAPQLHNVANQAAAQNALKAKQAASQIFSTGSNIIDVTPP